MQLLLSLHLAKTIAQLGWWTYCPIISTVTRIPRDPGINKCHGLSAVPSTSGAILVGKAKPHIRMSCRPYGNIGTLRREIWLLTSVIHGEMTQCDSIPALNVGTNSVRSKVYQYLGGGFPWEEQAKDAERTAGKSNTLLWWDGTWRSSEGNWKPLAWGMLSDQSTHVDNWVYFVLCYVYHSTIIHKIPNSHI